MASKMRNPAILRNIVKRNYAAEAAPKYIENTVSSKTSVLPNKIVVASSAPDSLISEVSISFKAGSRYETGEFKGITHVLRSVFGLGCEDITNFGLTRNVQQHGLNLYATTDREVISYTVQGNKDNIEHGFKYLISAVTKQSFKPWEISDNNERLKYDLVTIPAEARAIDLAHQAAYQYGLGNSLYIDRERIGIHGPETLQHYVKSNFTSSRASITGIGVNHEILVELANALSFESGSAPASSKPIFYGGDERFATKDNNVYVAVVAEGTGLNAKEAYAFAALQYALGAGPQVKYGVGVSPLSKAVSSLREPVGIAALNISYSDSGLFGVLFATSGQQSADVAKIAAKALKSGNVSAEDAKRGIAQLHAALAFEAEKKPLISDDLRSQATSLGAVQDFGSVVKAISSLSPTDVQSAAKKVATGNLALGAVGNVNHIPYVDLLVK